MAKILGLFFIISFTLLVKSEESFKGCGTTSEEAHRIKRYVLKNHLHSKENITYKVTDYSKNVSKADTDFTIDLAFRLWEAYIPNKFLQLDSSSDDKADIELRFGIRDHGDKWPFDGPGGTLAHALKQWVHFDDEETWKVNNEGEGTNLLWVATHEIGHSLGLDHTSVEGAIMFPWYYHQDKVNLHNDDIEGIQEIYSVKKDQSKFHLDLCKDPDFDAMFDTPDGKTYIFKSDVFYELNGVSIVNGPKKISSTWKELPTDINAAFTQKDKTFFFKNGLYWKYSGYKLEEGYPERLDRFYSEIPDIVDSAFLAKDGTVYFVRGSKYYHMNEYDESYTNVTNGKIADIFPGVPNHLDAGFYSSKHKRSYFFKDGSFYVLADNDDRPGYEIPISVYFFDCSQ